jgi:hypothetical protein
MPLAANAGVAIRAKARVVATRVLGGKGLNIAVR